MAKTSTSFKKGQIANPNGAPKKEESLTNLMREFLKEIPTGEKKTYKELFVRKCFALAMKGDIPTMRLIWNYLEGMPHQTTDANIAGELKIVISSESAKRYGLPITQDTETSST